MPPKRNTRTTAAATKPTTQTRTTRAGGAPAAPSPAAKPAGNAARTTTSSKTAVAALSRRTKKAPTSAPPQQLDGATDDDIIDTATSNNDNNNSGDDSDTLAISNRPARLFRRANRDSAAASGGDDDGNRSKAEDYVMTGALGEGDVAGAHVAAMQKKNGGRNVRTRGRMARGGGVTKQRMAARDPEQARALEALRRRRQEAMGGTVAAATEPAEVERDEEEEEDEGRGRRQEVPGTASRVRRASSSHWSNAIPGSAVKAQGTPAAERSVLALTKFQKRRRQGSLLRMMQQSDVEDNTDGDGDVDDSAATLDYSLGDFEPDHESTPLNMGRKGSMAAALPGSEPRTSSSRKRKLAERDETVEQSTVQVPRSSPPPAMEDQELADGEETSSEHLYSEASELPEAVADTQPEADETMADKTATESMAPPRSTSPLSSLPAEPEPEEAPAKRPRRAAARPATSNSRASRRVSNIDAEDHGADPLSTSELESDTATETPVIIRTSRKKPNMRKGKPLSLSTATLQSLLPRRRKKLTTRAAKTAAGGTFEIPSSSDAEREDETEEQESADEDELQRPPSAAARRGRGRKNVAAAKASDSTVRVAKKQSTAAKGKKGKKRPSQTYGQRFSDKENQDASAYVRSGGESDGDDDNDDIAETSEIREMKRSKELEAAARKFKEVDDWEMEFESVDMGGASASSPWR